MSADLYSEMAAFGTGADRSKEVLTPGSDGGCPAALDATKLEVPEGCAGLLGAGADFDSGFCTGTFAGDSGSGRTALVGCEVVTEGVGSLLAIVAED